MTDEIYFAMIKVATAIEQVHCIMGDDSLLHSWKLICEELYNPKQEFTVSYSTGKEINNV